MNTDNNTFSFNRLSMLIRWDFGANWKTYAWRYSGLYLGFFALIMFLSILESITPNSPNDDWASPLLFFFMIMSFRSARLVMEPMNTKEGRTLFLSLPASHVEKFVWRVFFASVVYFFVGIVAFVLADLTSYLLCLMLEHQYGLMPAFHIGTYVESLGQMLLGHDAFNEHLKLPHWCNFFLSFGYFIFSLSLLSGCVKSRKGEIMILVGFLLIVWGTPELLKHFAPEGLSAIYAPAAWINGVFGVLSILCWIFAYRFFRRSQIV